MDTTTQVVLRDLLANTKKRHASVFEKFDVRAAIDELDRARPQTSYHFIPPTVKALWNRVEQRFGSAGFAAFQCLTMLELIDQFSVRARDKRYTDAVLSKFTSSFDRIIRAIADADRTGVYRSANDDLLLKDLAICRQSMFPAGAQIVEPHSAFHRVLLFRGGLGQFAAVAALLRECGGNKPFYQIHTHLSDLSEFNPDGWDRCYLMLADMLCMNPEIRGMWGGSWFYDPALEHISPNLTYLRERPQKNGAVVVYSHVDMDGGALSRSKTRRELFEAGRYVPKSYALVWPREKMLAWATSFASARSR
jgi:hypothetical protein